MFWAIIKNVYEELIKKGYSDRDALKEACYNSAEINRNWSRESRKGFIYWDCSGIETLITDKKKVSYVKPHDRKASDTWYRVRAYFRLGNDEKVTYSMSDDKHTTAQHILAGLILNNEKIKIKYRDIPFYLNDLNLIIKDRTKDHILEQSFIDKEIGVNRFADLLFELETPNLTFGKGIVFEIMNTESLSSIKEKSIDWAKAGYSLVAIPISNFDLKELKLKDDNYLVMYRLFDDLNIYLEILSKIRENGPLIDNFNSNVREMERKMFLWRSGRHNFRFLNNEKVSSILLYCINSELKNFKGKEKFILNCYDFSNKLIDVDIWDTNPLFEKIKNNNLSKELLKIESCYFKEYIMDISLVLNSYSKIKIIDINSGDDYDKEN